MKYGTNLDSSVNFNSNSSHGISLSLFGSDSFKNLSKQLLLSCLVYIYAKYIKHIPSQHHVFPKINWNKILKRKFDKILKYTAFENFAQAGLISRYSRNEKFLGQHKTTGRFQYLPAYSDLPLHIEAFPL